MDAAGLVSLSMEMKDNILSENPIELVPLLHESVLAPDPLDGLSAKLVKEISAIKKTSRTGRLSPAGKQRYRRNCEIIRMVQKGLTPRNLAILQVYEEEQWKEEFPTVADFAKAFADLSKSQLFKVLDEGRIYYVFADAGLLAILPTGRCREELVKVEMAHWIPAWKFALESCRDHKIPFGRRCPNATSFQLPSPPDNGTEAMDEPPEDWKTRLTPEMKKFIRGVVSFNVVERVESSFATKAAENVILDSILSLEPSKLGPEDALPWKELFQLIHRHEPEVYQTLILLALERCKDVIGKAVLARCRKNEEGKALYRRNRGKKTTDQ